MNNFIFLWDQPIKKANSSSNKRISTAYRGKHSHSREPMEGLTQTQQNAFALRCTSSLGVKKGIIMIVEPYCCLFEGVDSRLRDNDRGQVLKDAKLQPTPHKKYTYNRDVHTLGARRHKKCCQKCVFSYNIQIKVCAVINVR